MDDRDYKVVYRTRPIDSDGERPRVREALDPYYYPEDRDELKRAVAEARVRARKEYDTHPRDEYDAPISRAQSRAVYEDDHVTRTPSTVQGPRTTKTYYSVDRGSVAREDSQSIRSGAAGGLRSGARHSDFEISRGWGHPTTSYEIVRPERQGRTYVVNTRPGAEIYVEGAGELSRELGDYRIDRYPSTRENARPSTSRRASSVDRREYCSEREEEWGFINAAKKGPDGSVRGPPPNLQDETFRSEARSRRRAKSNAKPPSEEDYVVVSPPRTSRKGRPTERDERSAGLRSAIFSADTYTPEERLQRRRSRSISFRDFEVDQHYCGDRKRERPGAEAAGCGRYLQHYEPLDDGRSNDDRAYSRRSRDEPRRESRNLYVKEDGDRYPPQQDRPSRRRRDVRDARDDEDDESYYSGHYHKIVREKGY